MTEPLWNHGDHGGATAVYAVQAPQWNRASGVTGVSTTVCSQVLIYTAEPTGGVNGENENAQSLKR